MQYIATTKGTPSKIEDITLPDPIRMSEEGNIVITEKRDIHMTKIEFLNSIKALNDRLKFIEYELSKDYINKIKRERDDIIKKKEMFENFLKKIKDEV